MAILWYRAPDSGIDCALEFDATLQETPSFTADVTEHPVEEGVPVSDHVRRGLKRLTLEVVITNTPIVPSTLGASPAPIRGVVLPMLLTTETKKAVAPAGVGGGFTPPFFVPGLPRQITPITVTPATYISLQKTQSIKVLQFTEQMDRVKFVFRQLESLIDNGVPVGVDTYLKFYDQMLLTSLGAPREGKDSINFSMDLVEFRTATVQTAVVSKRRPAQKRAVAAVAAGPKGTGYPPTSRDQKDLESIARRLENEALGIKPPGA